MSRPARVVKSTVASAGARRSKTTQALASAMLDRAGVADLLPLLLPLAAFAVALPLAGALAFRWLDRLVRRRGELDLY